MSLAFQSSPPQGSQPERCPVKAERHGIWSRRYRKLFERGATVALVGCAIDVFVTCGISTAFCLASNLVTRRYLKAVDYDKKIEKIPVNQLTPDQKKYLIRVGKIKRCAQKLSFIKFKINRKYFAYRSSQVSQALNFAYGALIFAATSSTIGVPVAGFIMLYAAGRMLQTELALRYENLSEAERNKHPKHRFKRMAAYGSGTTGLLEAFPVVQYGADMAAMIATQNYAAAAADATFIAQCGFNFAGDIVQFKGVDMVHYKDWVIDWKLRREARSANRTQRGRALRRLSQILKSNDPVTRETYRSRIRAMRNSMKRRVKPPESRL